MTGYDQNLFAKGIVLGALEHGPLTGADFLDLVKSACRVANRTHAGFDFIFWAGCPLWDLMDTMVAYGFVETKATVTPTAAAWQRTEIRLSEKGRDFLTTLRKELMDRGVTL